MIFVSINGLRQIPGIDYVSGADYVTFSAPPALGDLVSIDSPYGKSCDFRGNGTTYKFQLDDLSKKKEIMNLLVEAHDYYDHPAVADAMEKLAVVVSLVKQDGRSRV